MNARTKDIIVTCTIAIFFIGMSLFIWMKPAHDFSEAERRKLKQFPKFTWNSMLSSRFVTDFEAYTLDQFPFRDEFRSLKANVSIKIFGKKDNNEIYVEDGYVSEMEYPMNEDSMNRAATRFRNVYDRFLADKDVNVYFSMIPDKNYFLAEKNGYLSIDYDVFFDTMIKKTDFMKYIDITKQLNIQDYYKTDTHWKQECLVDVAENILTQMNATIHGEYEEYTLNNPFYGVYYGQSAMNLESEEIKYLSNEYIENYVIYDYENDKEISVYDMEKAYGVDPYEMFLSGSLSLITIENPNANTEKELILFRDSFGSSIAPLLAEGYAKTTLVDIRYIQPEVLDRYIDFDNQDVLFLYSTLVLNNSETIK